MTATPTRRDAQPRVLDLTASQRAPRVEFDVSPVYELLVVLQALSTPESWSTYDQGASWFDDLRSRMSNDLRAVVDDNTGREVGCRSEWVHLAGLVFDAPDRTDTNAVIEHISTLPASIVYRTLIESAMHGAARRSHAALLDAAVGGDADSRRRLLEVVGEACEDTDQEVVRMLLERRPEDVRAGVVTALREAAILLQDYLATIVPALRHDADLRLQRVRGLPVEEAVQEGTDGIHWTPEAGVRRVLLVPQAAMRPWVLISEHADTKIFMVAVAEESLTADLDAPPPRLLAVLKALGEEQRLRILRRLATGGPASLQQIADHIGVAKSTAHHHLVQLRAAGLTVVELGDDRDYRIREGLTDDVMQLLATYLKGGHR